MTRLRSTYTRHGWYTEGTCISIFEFQRGPIDIRYVQVLKNTAKMENSKLIGQSQFITWHITASDNLPACVAKCSPRNVQRSRMSWNSGPTTRSLHVDMKWTSMCFVVLFSLRSPVLVRLSKAIYTDDLLLESPLQRSTSTAGLTMLLF